MKKLENDRKCNKNYCFLYNQTPNLMQSHLAFLYIKKSVLIKHTICKRLVQTQFSSKNIKIDII